MLDMHRLTVWKRAMSTTPSRRDLIRGLAGAGIGLGSLGLADPSQAKSKNTRSQKTHKKRKAKKRAAIASPPITTPLTFNQFGCIAVGLPCGGDNSLCCSGICQGSAPAAGQPDTSRCLLHHPGTCKQEGDGICGAVNPAALKCNNSAKCACIQTTAGSIFCYDASAEKTANICAECKKDADCETLGYPAGSACAPISSGNCAGLCATGMACLAPCS
jgi:hypothetical protein